MFGFGKILQPKTLLTDQVILLCTADMPPRRIFCPTLT